MRYWPQSTGFVHEDDPVRDKKASGAHPLFLKCEHRRPSHSRAASSKRRVFTGLRIGDAPAY